MDIDEEKVDDAVLALLRLTLHDGYRAWKGFDWGGEVGGPHRGGAAAIGGAACVAVREGQMTFHDPSEMARGERSRAIR